MHMKVIFISTWFLVSFATTHAAVVREGTTLQIRGRIDEATWQAYRGISKEGIKTVSIQSGGGDSAPAIRIGDAIREANYMLIVDGVCASACAHFIFVAAKHRTISSQGLIVFHNTNSSILRMIKGAVDESAAKVLRPAQAVEQTHYQKWGVDAALLLQPQLEIGTTCYKYFRDAAGNVSDVKFQAPYNGWVPSRAAIEAFGVTFAGFWPSDAQSFYTVYTTHFQVNRGPRLKLGGNVMDPKRMSDQYEKIRPCP